MKKIWMALAAVATVAVAGAAHAQSSVVGEVTKLDKGAARITLKHEGIKQLDMPPMAMSFKLRDAKLADGVAVGDRVRFAAERIDGQYTVVSLSKAP